MYVRHVRYDRYGRLDDRAPTLGAIAGTSDYDLWLAGVTADGAAIVAYPQHEDFFTALVSFGAPLYLDWFGRPAAQYAGSRDTLDPTIAARVHLWIQDPGTGAMSGLEVPPKSAMVAWWYDNVETEANQVGQELASAIPSVGSVVWPVVALASAYVLVATARSRRRR